MLGIGRRYFLSVGLLVVLAVTVIHTSAQTVENQDEKRNDEQARIVEHKISTSELEEIKWKQGVWEEGKNYNLIINGHGTGLRPPTNREWAEIADKAYVVESVLLSQPAQAPPSIDQTATPWFPPIGNQDGEGSCVAWAVGYYTKTYQEAKEHGWDLSAAAWIGGYTGYPTPAYQDRIMSPDFIYHLINGGEDFGASFYNGINLVCTIGASSWEKMPYNPVDHATWPSEEAWREAPLYRGNSSGFEAIVFNTDADIISLKNWIATDHLAIIGVDANQYPSLTSNDVWTVTNYANPSVNHANTVVGYDDNFAYREEGQLRYGAFKVANSWGIGEGQKPWENVLDGCYWISYKAMKLVVGYCMFYRDRVGYDPSLLASFKVDHAKRGECSILIGMGNHNAPVTTKSFSDSIVGGIYPFGSNNIVFDITEFENAAPTVLNQPLFMRVADRGEPYAHSGTHYWYSGGTVNSWFSFYRTFSIPATGATLNFWSYYEIEEDWDYGYVEVYDVNRGQWYTLPGLTTVSTLPARQDNPNCPPEYEPSTYFALGRWNAFTGFSNILYEEEMDLTPFAGHTIQLYFTYWTDAYTLERGWYIDDIAIPEIGFFDNVENGLNGWTVSGGWNIATPQPTTPTTGTILSFSIEHYQSYNPVSLKAVSTSHDVPVNTVDLSYVFAFTIAGDVNGDHNVNHDDLVILAGAYSSNSSAPAYTPNADFDKDSDIDCHDLIILARNYGEAAG